MVVWIIGLSGSGKTTLAQEVASLVRKKGRSVAIVDGDVIRAIFGNDVDYSLEGRMRNAERICALCKFLEDQNIDVVCAILSIFRESREWNRKHLKRYYEVYIEAPLEQLTQRDSKGIYGKYARGETKDVAGMDLEFPIPEQADLVIKNNTGVENLLRHAPVIAEKILG